MWWWRKTMKTIVDCLGRERTPEKVWPDGSYNCPFCFGAVMGTWTACHNPACWARGEVFSPYPVEAAREALAAAEAKLAAEKEREELKAWRSQYAAEQAAEEAARWAAAVRDEAAGGPCAQCFRASGYRKKVRHRTTCKAKVRFR
jgi:hypothetical protein